MGLYVAVLVLSFVFAVNATIDKIVLEKCLKEIGITRDDYLEGTSFDTKEVDVKYKCVNLCMLKELNMITKEGIIDVETTVKEISQGQVDQVQLSRRIVDTCAKDKINDCHSAYNFVNCINEKFVEFYSQS